MKVGKEQPSTWYDNVYAESETYAMDAESAPWAPLWKNVASRLKKTDRVIDIGCGPGHVAEMLQGKVRSYVGIDFSGKAIQQARKRVPGITFRWADARTYDLPDGDVYLFLEVLEHLTEDIELVCKVPSGKRVIITVPGYDSESHVRHFESAGDVIDRYCGAVVESDLLALDRWFILAGTRR